MGEYLDKLEEELRAQGVGDSVYDVARAENQGDTDLKTILKMQKLLGVEYSDEQKAILSHRGNSVILACAGSGKALTNDTLVLTDKGYRPIGTLKVGDTVFDYMGNEQVVLGVYPQGKKRINRVRFNTGDVINCCSEHLWTIKRLTSDHWEVVDTQTLRDNIKTHKEYIVPHSLDIYDGNYNVACSDAYLDLVRKTVISYKELGNLIWEHELDNDALYDIYDVCRSDNSIRSLYDFCLGDCYDIATSKQVKSVIKVACEMFGMSTYYEKGTQYARTIVGIEETNRYAEMTCIRVSGISSTFLTEHCIPTHNTTISTHLIAKRIDTGEIKNVNNLIYMTYSKPGAEEMEARMQKVISQMGYKYKINVRTIHSFFYGLMKEFGYNKKLIEDGAKYKIIQGACKDAGFSPKEDDIMMVLNLISFQVNNLYSDKKTFECVHNNIENLTFDQYTQIKATYARKKAEMNCIDYDDMELYLYTWAVAWSKSSVPNQLEFNKAMLAYCKSQFTDIYIDEAQDIGRIQFDIIRAMTTDESNPNKLVSNLTIIGDDDQCLIEGTQITTATGLKNIEDIMDDGSEYVLAGSGFNDTVYRPVTNKSRRWVEEDIIEITTKSGKVIRGTRNHVGYSRITSTNNMFYIVLIYKKNVGFRLVQSTKLVTLSNKEQHMDGVDEKLINDEADSAWVVGVYDSRSDMNHYTQYYVCKYSIPTTSLKSKEMHSKLDTMTSGFKMLKDLMIDFNYPHKEVIRKKGRHTILCRQFCTRDTTENGIHQSKATIRTTHGSLIRKMDGIFGKSGSHANEYENTSTDIKLQNKQIKTFISKLNNVEAQNIRVSEQTYLTKVWYNPMPFGNMFVGMQIPVVDGERVIDDEIVSIKRVPYKGYVYDLEVQDVHNFVADGVVVHNCIYEWRGSDPSIIQSVGSDFNIKTMVLSTNYRCQKEIVDFASTGIKCNAVRYAKGMNAYMDGGSVKIKIVSNSEHNIYDMSKEAVEQIKKWIADGSSASDIAVLCRNNKHLAIVSALLLGEGIYYNSPKEMKVCKGISYTDLKSLMDLCEPCYKSDIFGKIFWKFNRYIRRDYYLMIGKFMNEASLSVEQALWYICKRIMKLPITEEKKLTVGMEADGKVIHAMNCIGINSQNAQIFYEIYKSINLSTREERLNSLISLYRANMDKLQLSKDTAREIRSLLSYANDLSKKKGFDHLKEFLRILEQMERGSVGALGEKVTLSTVHSAKGREWKNVIMFACDNITEPSFDRISTLKKSEKATDSDLSSYVDEERRLFYVGSTRAKNNLLLLTSPSPSVFLLNSLGVGISNQDIINYAMNGGYGPDFKDEISKHIVDKDSKFSVNTAKPAKETNTESNGETTDSLGETKE